MQSFREEAEIMRNKNILYEELTEREMSLVAVAH